MATQKNSKDALRIEISINRSSVRRALVVGGSLILFTIVGAAIAVPVTSNDGNVLTSAQLNSNFNHLEQRMAAAEKRLTDNGKYTVGATFCAATGTNHTGNLGGYVAGKALCETACGNSATAHMCVTEELLRSVATGVSVPFGWYSSGTFNGQSGSTQRDCQKWSSADGGELGSAYLVYGLFTSTCDTSQPVLCCD